MTELSQVIKVLLVDDSGFMRIVLADIINAQKDIKVIDTASNGKEAVEKTILIKPDVVLLDLTMAEYDGMYAIKKIMEQFPVPIVILSSIRATNPSAVLDALNAGAVDFLDKPVSVVGSNIRQIDHLICTKIKQAASANLKNVVANQGFSNQNNHTFENKLNYDFIVIGASTGGTGAIEQILVNLPQNLPIPVVVCQHMPPEFIHSFAERLNQATPIHVKVATENEELLGGHVYLMPGHTNTKIIEAKNGYNPRFVFTSDTFAEYNNPSINCIMASAAMVYKEKCMGIILTGMGKDGTIGLSKIYNSGGYTIAQDEKSSIVYGMPKEAFEAQVVKKVVSLQNMAGFIISALC